MTITIIGLDLAKSVFQAHGVDASGKVVLTKRLHRKQMLPFFSKLPPCLIGIEACATAHHWGRTLAAMGHEVRLIPPSYVKAYLNDERQPSWPWPSAKLAAACSRREGVARL